MAVIARWHAAFFFPQYSLPALSATPPRQGRHLPPPSPDPGISPTGQSAASYREALQIRRQLAEAQPAVFTVDLANTLGAFGLFHLQSGDPAQALVYQEEAINLLRPYARQHPQVFGGKQAFILYLAARAAVREALPLARGSGLEEAIEQLAAQVCGS